MDVLQRLIDTLGTANTLALGGLIVGMGFGFFAQRSKFCLRSATIEVANGQWGGKLAIWLLTFAMALLLCQLMLQQGWLMKESVRQISSVGSLAGAMIGGAIFGVGMILARGCPSRLLVLSGQGNLRALMTGMLFAVMATVTYKGLLSPLREWLTSLWLVSPDLRDMGDHFGLSFAMRLGLAVTLLVAALFLGLRSGLSPWVMTGAIGVGTAVAAAWFVTAQIGFASFDPVPVNGITFSGPSSDVLLRVLSPPDRPLDFDTAMVPGVVIGALIGALFGRDWKLEGFHEGLTMPRYIAGGLAMGFGAILAGGCAVGAGVTGGAVLSLTAWVALFSMWMSAMIAHWLVDGRPAQASRSISQ